MSSTRLLSLSLAARQRASSSAHPSLQQVHPAEERHAPPDCVVWVRGETSANSRGAGWGQREWRERERRDISLHATRRCPAILSDHTPAAHGDTPPASTHTPAHTTPAETAAPSGDTSPPLLAGPPALSLRLPARRTPPGFSDRSGEFMSMLCSALSLQ